ncbi:hypothetical protein HYV71_05035 [Candidatus Uhrbacteria bacterium]|nr:hypothetical protein [Candidatus Uhrbacteria bacterium]
MYTIICKELTGEQCDFKAEGATHEDVKTVFYRHGADSDLHREKYHSATPEEAAEFGKKVDAYLERQT